jgi:hypothetical protein
MDEIERKIYAEILEARCNYMIARNHYWNPRVSNIINKMHDDFSFASDCLEKIDKAAKNPESYSKSNVLMEIVLYGVLSKDKIFKYDKYIAIAKLYAPTLLSRVRCSKKELINVVLSTLYDVDDKMIYKIFKVGMVENEDKMSIIHELYGLDEFYASKKFEISNISDLSKRINDVFNVSSKDSFESISDSIKSCIILLNVGYNSKELIVLKKFNTSLDEYPPVNVESMLIKKEKWDKENMTTIINEGKYDKWIVLLQYDDLYIVLTKKINGKWIEILNNKPNFKPKNRDDILNFSIHEALKHNAFIFHMKEQKEIKFINDKIDDYEKADDKKPLIKWEKLSIIEKAHCNLILRDVNQGIRLATFGYI